MKRLKIFSISLMTLGCVSCGQGADWAEVETYFLNHLEGNATVYDSHDTIKSADVDAYRDKVWAAWCGANAKFTEDKLPEIVPLSERKATRWTLPASMEPYAIMPFYWGNKGEKPAEGWPLFLYMHGSGPKADEWNASYELATRFADAPSVYFIPQIPNEGRYYRWWQKSKLFAWERLMRQAFVNGQINPNRFYMFGISEGAYGSQRLASFYADYLAAAGPMAGGETPYEAPAENCGHIGFSLLTGGDDRTFARNELTHQAQMAFDSLAQAYPGEYRHRIETIPGYGHHIDYSPTTPWLSQFTRQLHPKHFVWIDFSLDGVFRKGFYNLAIHERATEENNLRTRYDMTIKDNVVDLKVNKVVYEATSREPIWGVPITFDKHYTPAEKGALTLYLNDEMVDFEKPVKVLVNGKQLYSGRVTATLTAMVSSCECFFDPERVYPVAIELQW